MWPNKACYFAIFSFMLAIIWSWPPYIDGEWASLATPWEDAEAGSAEIEIAQRNDATSGGNVFAFGGGPVAGGRLLF